MYSHVDLLSNPSAVSIHGFAMNDVPKCDDDVDCVDPLSNPLAVLIRSSAVCTDQSKFPNLMDDVGHVDLLSDQLAVSIHDPAMNDEDEISPRHNLSAEANALLSASQTVPQEALQWGSVPFGFQGIAHAFQFLHDFPGRSSGRSVLEAVRYVIAVHPENDNWTFDDSFDGLELDHVGFMQSNVPRFDIGDTPQMEQLQNAIEQVGIQNCGPLHDMFLAHGGSLQEFCHSLAAPSPPAAPPAVALPNALRNLQEYFRIQTQGGADDQQRNIVTWYLNHETYPHCEQFRQIDIGTDPRSWVWRIIHLWRDLIVPGESYQFMIVRPNPPGFEAVNGVTPHVILQQQPRNGFRSVVLSGSSNDMNPGDFAHQAVVIPMIASKEIIVRKAGVFDFCQPISDEIRCQVWKGSTNFPRSQIIHVEAGNCFLVIAFHMPLSVSIPTFEGAENDVVTLMQNPDTFGDKHPIPGSLVKPITDSHDPCEHEVPSSKCRKLYERQVQRNVVQDDDPGNDVEGPNQHVPPEDSDEFLLHLFDIMEHRQVQEGIDHVMHVRTWFIDHFRHEMCFRSRPVFLDARWTTWADRICDVWDDRVERNQASRIYVVKPEAMQASLNDDSVADVILIQGHEDQRRAVLVTLNHIRDPPSVTSAAFSIRGRFSGVSLFQDARSLETCLNADCKLFHVNQEIPLDDNRRYVADDGNWCLIQMQEKSGLLNVANFQRNSLPMSLQQQIQEFHVLGIPVLPEELYGIFVHGLERTSQFAFLSWNSYQHLILDAARFLNVRPTRIWAIHEVQASPVGAVPDTATVIVQFAEDLPLGATDKLVLLDIEEHRHPDVAIGQITPFVSRRVKRMPNLLTRQQLISRAHVALACERLRDCLVYVDNSNWNRQDLTLKQLEHGMYLRIVIPPDPQVENCDSAASVSSTAGHSPQLPSRSPSMLQLCTIGGRLDDDDDNDFICDVRGPGRCQFGLPPLTQLPASHFRGVDAFSKLIRFWQQDAESVKAEGSCARVVRVWFLDHVKIPICHEAKEVCLPENRALWIRAIELAWNDFVDSRNSLLPFFIDSCVNDSHKPTPCILVHQSPHVDQRSIFVIVQDVRGTRVSEFAHVLPAKVEQTAFVRRLDERITLPDDGNTIWNISHNGKYKQQHEPLELRNGDVLAITLKLSHDIEGDAGCSMQTTAEISRARLDIHWRNGVLQGADLPTLLTESTFVQELFAHWRMLAGGIEGECEAATLCTWYVDYIDYKRCAHSRSVTLFEDFHTWTTRLVAAWDDFVDPMSQVHFHIITPQPIENNQQSCLHVLLVQNPNQHSNAVMISLYDNSFAVPLSRRVVQVVAALATDLELVAPVGMWHHCKYGPLKDTCACFNALGPLPKDPDSFRTKIAEHFFVIIQHDTGARTNAHAVNERQNEDVQDAALSMLQLQVTAQKTTHEVEFDTPETMKKDFEFMLQNAVDVPSRDQEIVVGSRRIPISLEAALPDEDAVTIAEDISFQWFEKRNWYHQCVTNLSISIRLSDLPEGLKVKKSTYHALTQPTNIDFGSCHWMLFVDGAANEVAAAWSVVLVATDGAQQQFCGCTYGLVNCDVKSSCWLGATQPNNIAAEFTAFTIAQCLVLQWNDSGSYWICPDLTLGQLLAKKLVTPMTQPAQVQVIRLLSDWIGDRCTYHHVPGHKGHAWNELADSLAGFALNQGQNADHCNVKVVQELMRSSTDLSWAWMQDSTASVSKCFPPLVDECGVVVEPSLKKLASKVPKQRQPAQVVTISMSCVSANVLALDANNDNRQVGRHNAPRTARLDEQWHRAGVHILGLQETRTQQGKTQSEHYHILSSGADTSNTATHGCELWYHKTKAIIHDKDCNACKLAEVPVTVQWADPRRLIVLFDSKPHPFSAVVLHVPCLVCTDKGREAAVQELQDWWDQTAELINRYVQLDFCTVFIDANAPLGTHECDNFGMFGAEPGNAQGEMFETFLQDMRFMVPATFEEFHNGRHTTWTHPRGMKFRRDYIVIPLSMRTWINGSNVMQDHDNAFSHEDHLPVHLQIDGWMEFESPDYKIKWDPAKFKDPAICQQFQAALGTLPMPTWKVNVDEHNEWYEHQLLQIARNYFEVTEKKKARPTLTQSTLNLIQFKRSCLDFGRANDCMQDESFKAELKATEKLVTAAVWKDTRAFYDNLVQGIQEAGEGADFRTVYQMLTRLGSKRCKRATRFQPLSKLKKADGSMAASFHEQQIIWLKQFAEIEAGTFIHRDNLASAHRPGLGLQPGEHDVQVVPTEHDILLNIRKMKRGKAPGPNQIPPDVYKAGDTVIAKQMAPILTKVALHAKEPLAWKGGFLTPLFKKGEASNPLSYRSIFVSNYSAKIYHATLRSQLLEVWEQALSHLHYGGRPGKATDMAHQHLQSSFAHAKMKKRPAAALFFDVKSAFYMVLREVLVQFEDSRCATIHAFKQLGIGEDEIDRMLKDALTQNATSGLPAHAARLLRDVLSGTYFEVKGLDVCVQTHRGTRPGDPVGDILFNLCMSMIVHDVKVSVEENTQVPWSGNAELVQDFTQHVPVACPSFGDISYVDDCVFCICAASNEQVEQIAISIVTAMEQSVARRGLQLNFEKGKTEIMISPAGTGVRAWRQNLAQNDQCLLWKINDAPKCLRVVHSYKHLGTWLQEGCKHGREVQHRASNAKASWGPLIRSFYAKKTVALKTKVQIFSSLTMSRLLYNCHVWENVDNKDLKKWHDSLRSALYPLARSKLKGLPPFQLETTDLCGLIRLQSPMDAMNKARLLYLKRFLASCPIGLWSTIWETRDTQGSWIQLCHESFAWLLKFCPKPLPMKHDDSFHSWIAYIALDTQWKGRVRAAAASCLEYRLATAEQEVWMRNFDRRLAEYGIATDEGVTDANGESWECELCSKVFPTKRGLAMHAHKCHGYTTKVKYYAIGDTCQVCLKWYHCRARLCSHLTTSHACRETLAACYPPLPDDLVKQLDDDDRIERRRLKQQGWWATKAFLPVMKVCGPALPPPTCPDAQILFEKACRNQHVHGAAFEQLQGFQTAQQANEEQNESLGKDFPQFVIDSPEGHLTAEGRFDDVNLANELAILHIRCRLFVHFYSGFRRAGDLHEVVMQLACRDNTQLFFISIDMCMQKSLGDLSTASSLAFWIDKICRGFVMGAGGGPPCETFTAARYMAGGPPPLRSAEHWSGLPALRPRQWIQTQVGTRLIHFLLDILLCLAAHGGCGFAEHPQYPTWLRSQKPPSLWACKAVSKLKRLKCVSITSFDQCIFSKDILKPTTLLLLRLPQFRADVRSRGCMGRCVHGKGAHQSLCGVDEHGDFRTAVGKVYPTEMNLALGRAIFGFAQSIASPECGGEPLPADVEAFCQDVYAEDSVVQPDFHFPS